MRLIGSELRKVCANRFLVILLFLLLLVNVLMVWRTQYEENNYGPCVSAMLDAYAEDPEGFMAECRAQEKYLDEIEALQKEYARAQVMWMIRHPGEEFTLEYPWEINRFAPPELSDWEAIDRFYAVLKRAETVERVKTSLIDRAKIFYSLYRATGETDSFAACYQVRLANRYITEDRDAVTYPLVYGYGWDNYLTYGGDSVFLLIAAVLIGAVIVLPERTGGFAAILRVSKCGRSHTMLAKGAVAALLSVALSLLFSGVTLLAFWGRYGFSGLNLPLQSFFPYAIWHVRVWQAVLIRMGIRCFGVFCVMMFCVLLSVFFKRAVTVYFCGGAVVGMFYVFSQLQLFNEHSPLYLFNIFTILEGRDYIEHWNGVSLFGLCFDYGVMLPLLLVAVGLLLLAATVIAFSAFRGGARRNGRLSARISAWRAACAARLAKMTARRKRRLRTLSLDLYEWRKLFCGVLPVLLCVALVVFGARTAYKSLVLPETYDEYLERQYMDVLEGELTEEKRQFILTLDQDIRTIKGQYRDMAERYRKGEIDYETYTVYITSYNDAVDRADVVQKLVGKVAYIDRMAEKGIHVDLVYAVGWERIFTASVDYTLAAFLILILSGVYSFERRNRFSMILNSTKNGRWRTAFVKLRVTLLLSGGLGLASFLYRVLLVLTGTGLTAAHSPAASIEVYGAFGGSLIQLLLLSGGLRVIGAVTLGLFCYALSALFERTVPVMTITACAVFAVPLLHVFDVAVMDNWMLNGLLGGMAPLLSGAGAVAAVIWCVAALLLTALSLRKTAMS